MFCWTVLLNGGPNTFRCAAVAVKHNVFAFGGGCYGDSVQMDVRVFNTVSLRWRKLTPETDGRGDGHPVPEGPSNRQGHTAVLIDDVVYIWGGCGRWEYSNVLYAFDVDTHRWVRTEASGTVPERRENHSACVLGKVMYVYGGRIQTGYANDVNKLDTATMVWTLINARGTPPTASSRHSGTIIGRKMFVFGGGRKMFGFRGGLYLGAGQTQYYNTISVFDTETDLWLNTPSTQLLPKGRLGHSAFTYNGELYIFGGWDGRLFKDLWKFTPETFSWKQVKSKGLIHPSRMYSSCCCIVGDRIILFGGSGDDLFILDLSPSLTALCKIAVIQCSLDQSELPHNLRWELASMTTVVKKSAHK